MATITKRNGSYHIMVSGGYDMNNRQIRKCLNWKPDPGMTKKQIEKAVNEAVVLFEVKVRQGQVLSGNITFANFSVRWMSEYAEMQLAPKTVSRYRQFLKRILPAIGHVKLEKLQPLHLNEFYNKLADEGSWKERTWVARPSLIEKYKAEEHKITVLAKEAKIGSATLKTVLDRKPVTHETASRICMVMNMPLTRGFLEQQGKKFLGQRTIKHHHTLISSMLSTAVEWQIIHDNPAKRVKAPKAPRLEAKYLDE